eukprot:TRINITY_DN11254_c0_g1_i1.p1 TRINITY_DN11254_c0_g1~~TRINITY_DN11254_c0_g1_i1.p1  ORF type:complete len:852 (+),score=189.64 TRINITY_DN11254_c0_g1_i1:411-2966(+)
MASPSVLNISTQEPFPHNKDLQNASVAFDDEESQSSYSDLLLQLASASASVSDIRNSTSAATFLLSLASSSSPPEQDSEDANEDKNEAVKKECKQDKQEESTVHSSSSEDEDEEDQSDSDNESEDEGDDNLDSDDSISELFRSNKPTKKDANGTNKKKRRSVRRRFTKKKKPVREPVLTQEELFVSRHLEIEESDGTYKCIYKHCFTRFKKLGVPLWNHIKIHKSEESPEFLAKMLRSPSDKVRNDYEEENNLDSVLLKCVPIDLKVEKPHNWYLSRPKSTIRPPDIKFIQTLVAKGVLKSYQDDEEEPFYCTVIKKTELVQYWERAGKHPKQSVNCAFNRAFESVDTPSSVEQLLNSSNNVDYNGESEKHACEACSATSSSQWRNGPNGPKTLCNACYARYLKCNKLGLPWIPSESSLEKKDSPIKKERIVEKRAVDTKKRKVEEDRPVIGQKGVCKTGYMCESCSTTKSPEWRNGPGGPKTLCNACGVQYSKCKRKGIPWIPINSRFPKTASKLTMSTSSIPDAPSLSPPPRKRKFSFSSSPPPIPTYTTTTTSTSLATLLNNGAATTNSTPTFSLPPPTTPTVPLPPPKQVITSASTIKKLLSLSKNAPPAPGRKRKSNEETVKKNETTKRSKKRTKQSLNSPETLETPDISPVSSPNQSDIRSPSLLSTSPPLAPSPSTSPSKINGIDSHDGLNDLIGCPAQMAVQDLSRVTAKEDRVRALESVLRCCKPFDPETDRAVRCYRVLLREKYPPGIPNLQFLARIIDKGLFKQVLPIKNERVYCTTTDVASMVTYWPNQGANPTASIKCTFNDLFSRRLDNGNGSCLITLPASLRTEKSPPKEKEPSTV